VHQVVREAHSGERLAVRFEAGGMHPCLKMGTRHPRIGEVPMSENVNEIDVVIGTPPDLFELRSGSRERKVCIPRS